MSLFIKSLQNHCNVEKTKKYCNFNPDKLKSDLQNSSLIFQNLIKNDLRSFKTWLYGFEFYSVSFWEDSSGWSLLHDVIALNYIEIGKYLINEIKFDVNTTSKCISNGTYNLRPIHVACEAGNDFFLDLLLEKGANPELYVKAVRSELIEPRTDNYKISKQWNRSEDTLVILEAWNPLHISVMHNKTECVRILIEKSKVWVDARSTVSRKTALMLACKLNSTIQIIQLLLNANCDPNLIDAKGKTALYYAAYNGNIKAIEMLLKFGVILETETKKYQLSPFHAACISQSSNSKEVMIQLINYYQQSDSFLSQHCNWLLSKCLIDNPLKFTNHIELSNMTSFMLLIAIICLTDDERIIELAFNKIKLLIEIIGSQIVNSHCIINRITNVDALQLILMFQTFKHSPIFVTSINKQGCIDFLLEHTENLNNINSKSKTVLIYAVEANMIGIVRKLLNRGANPNIGQSSNGFNCLMIALDRQYKDIQSLLLKYNALTKSLDKPHYLQCSITYLVDSVYDEVEENLQLNKLLPLIVAIKRGDLEAVKLLIEYGADYNETIDIINTNNSKFTSNDVSILHILAGVCCNTEISIFKYIFNYLIDTCHMKINVVNGNNETPLMFAVKFLRSNKCQFLIEKGAELNVINNLGQNCLHLAASDKNKYIMKILILYGIDINQVDDNGITALQICLSHNFKDGIDMFLHPTTYWSCTTRLGANCECGNCRVRRYITKSLKIQHPIPSHTTGYLELAILHANVDNIVMILNLLNDDCNDYINREFDYNITELGLMTITPVSLLVESNCKDIDVLNAILQILIRHGCNLDYSSPTNNNTVLHMAIRLSNRNLARLLIHAGANTELRCKTRQGENVLPIHLASMMAMNDIVQLLIGYGSSINSSMILRSVERVTPLHLACLNDLAKTINVLISNDPNDSLSASVQLNTCRSDTFNALFTMVSKKNVNGVRKILHAGADVNCRCIVSRSRNATCLHIAAQVGNLEIVRLLLEYGADPMATMVTGDSKGILPIHLAVESGHNPIVSLLMEWGSCVNATPLITLSGSTNESDESVGFVNGFSCLHYAANNGNLAGARILIDFGANINARACDGNRSKLLPIHIAAQKGYKKFVQLLLENGSEIDAEYSRLNRVSLTSLYITTSEVRHDVIRLLIRCDANPNIRESSLGAIPFHIVCQKGYLKLLEYMLVMTNSNINSVLHTGISALHLTAEKGFTEMTFWLLRAGANPNLKGQITDSYSNKTSYDISALNQACGFGHLAIAQMLMHFGADREWCEVFEGNHGIRPIHCAAIRGRFNILSCLKDAGVDLNSQDDAGRTALHWAVKEGFYDCVRVLLELGVNPNIRDKTSSLAVEYAITSNIRRLFPI